MNRRTQRHILERHAVANVGRGRRTIFQLVASLNTLRSNDVPLLTVVVMQQRNIGTAIGIVLHRMNSSCNAILVALEVNHSKSTLVSATAMPSRNHALVIPPPLLLGSSKQPL